MTVCAEARKTDVAEGETLNVVVAELTQLGVNVRGEVQRLRPHLPNPADPRYQKQLLQGLVRVRGELGRRLSLDGYGGVPQEPPKQTKPPEEYRGGDCYSI